MLDSYELARSPSSSMRTIRNFVSLLHFRNLSVKSVDAMVWAQDPPPLEGQFACAAGIQKPENTVLDNVLESYVCCAEAKLYLPTNW